MILASLKVQNYTDLHEISYCQLLTICLFLNN